MSDRSRSIVTPPIGLTRKIALFDVFQIEAWLSTDRIFHQRYFYQDEEEKWMLDYIHPNISLNANIVTDTFPTPRISRTYNPDINLA